MSCFISEISHLHWPEISKRNSGRTSWQWDLTAPNSQIFIHTLIHSFNYSSIQPFTHWIGFHNLTSAGDLLHLYVITSNSALYDSMITRLWSIPLNAIWYIYLWHSTNCSQVCFNNGFFPWGLLCFTPEVKWHTLLVLMDSFTTDEISTSLIIQWREEQALRFSSCLVTLCSLCIFTQIHGERAAHGVTLLLKIVKEMLFGNTLFEKTLCFKFCKN